MFCDADAGQIYTLDNQETKGFEILAEMKKVLRRLLMHPTIWCRGAFTVFDQPV
jgi:hypothetical protein